MEYLVGIIWIINAVYIHIITPHFLLKAASSLLSLALRA